MSCPPILLLVTYLLYFGVATTASVPLSAPIDWLHEGERFGVAQMALAGGLPFRDVSIPHGLFPEMIRPLVAFRLLGESIAVDRVAGILLAPLAHVAAVFYLWQLFRSRWWRVVALMAFALYPLLLEPRHIPVFFALAFLTTGVRDLDPRRMFWGGTLCGLGFVLSTFDQAVFLCGMGVTLSLLFLSRVLPVVRPAAGAGVPGRSSGHGHLRAGGSLLAGLCLGLIPFLGYLATHGLVLDFLEDLRRRAEWEKFIAPIVWPGQAFPALPGGGPESAIWYVMPLFYLGFIAWLFVTRRSTKESAAQAIWPTLIFGVLSFGYAIRQYGYWKLAVVSFPFVAGAVFWLSLLDQEARSHVAPKAVTMLLVGALFIALAVLVGSLVRAWSPKQIWPRFMFPALAVGIGAWSASLMMGNIAVTRWRSRLVLLCPLVAFVVGIWFFNNAKPQILHVLLKKPQTIREVMSLSSQWRQARGGFSRDTPPMFNDDTLSYVKAARQEERPVLILAVGAGVYYFQAAVRPPGRYPHIEQAMSQASVEEIIGGLERTRAELLVACGDDGQRMTGWPMHPLFRDYVTSRYVDSGRRLRSLALGEGCLFSVWIHREMPQA